MLIVKKITLEDDLPWDELVKNSKTATFFQTKEWLKLWAKHFGGEMKILGVFEGENLIGIVPFEVRDAKVNFLGVNPVLGEELVTDFGDIITIEGREREVWEAVLSHLKNDSGPIRQAQGKQARMTIGLELNFIREDSPSFNVLKELGGKVEEVDVAPYINLLKSWEEYLAGLDRHDRHELRRKIQKIETEGVTLADYQGDINDIVEFFRLMTLGNEQKRGFLSSEMKDFFNDIIKTFYPDKLALSFLKKEEKYIVGALTFLFKDEVLLYNSGFDLNYSQFAPGLILKAYMIKRAIEEGKKRFDFLRGGERYKYDLGGKEKKLYRIIFD